MRLIDVADRPRQGGAQREQQRQGGGRQPARGRHDGQPGGPDEGPGQLAAARPLAERDAGQRDGADDLRLQHERGEPGRHPQVDPEVEQAELPEAHERPDGDDGPPRGVRARDDRDQRQRDQREAHRDEQQRGHAGEPLVDDDEVHPPHDGDEDGQRTVTGGHASTVHADDREDQQRFRRLTR